MKRYLSLVALLLSFSFCSWGQTDSLKMFMFGHSLMNYESINIPPDEGKIAHWMHLFAQSDDHYFASTGQFGFLPTHSMLPPSPNWGYLQVPPAWDEDIQSFAEAEFNSVMLTAGNFMEWQPSYFDYPTDPGLSPLSATEMIFDWVSQNSIEAKYYIYENWPDMARFLNNGFPPVQSEIDAYHDYCLSTFHDWWIEYQDTLLLSRPDFKVRMIPVGPIISKLHTELFPEMIPITSLYEDDAPHGVATTYFLAGLISYMAVYENRASYDFQVPGSIHFVIRNNYRETVDFIWDELNAFNDDEGRSRVFCEEIVSTEEEQALESLIVMPNPISDYLYLETDLKVESYEIFNLNGHSQLAGMMGVSMEFINVSELNAGVYFIHFKTKNQNTSFVRKIIKQD